MTQQEINMHAANIRDNNDNRSMQALIEQFTPLMTGLANRYDRMHHEDAVQDGCIGLWQAARKYDPSTGNSFITYAYGYISGYILRGIRSRHPVHTAVNRKIDDLLTDPDFVALNTPVSLSAIAGEDNWDVTSYIEQGFEDFENLDRASDVSRTLEAEIDRISASYMPPGPDPEGTSPDELSRKRDFVRRAARLWSGIETGEKMSYARVAEVLDCGKSEVRQTIRRVVGNLRTEPKVAALRTY